MLWFFQHSDGNHVILLTTPTTINNSTRTYNSLYCKKNLVNQENEKINPVRKRSIITGSEKRKIITRDSLRTKINNNNNSTINIVNKHDLGITR